MTTVLYPGSFDPVTYGHLDTAQRAARIFDHVVIAVFDRPNKNLLFSTDERLALLRKATQNLPKISVAVYNVLTVQFARTIGAGAIVRGMRSASDFEHEFQIAQVNQTIDADIDVVVLMASHKYSFISSSTVREMAALGGDVQHMVPPNVLEALRAKFRSTAS
jgi:pantetheine-phosphate adenylyltransferase